jgi:hypothetical protein
MPSIFLLSFHGTTTCVCKSGCLSECLHVKPRPLSESPNLLWLPVPKQTFLPLDLSALNLRNPRDQIITNHFIYQLIQENSNSIVYYSIKLLWVLSIVSAPRDSACTMVGRSS